MVPFFVLISLFSCSKDTDLLVDYIVSDFQEARLIGNLAINDNFVVDSQKSIVLDVLANDTFTDSDKVKIVETSQPTNGSVIINDDKTLTYFPDSADAPKLDTGNESEGSQPEPENNKTEGEENSPPQTDTVEETSQEAVTETPKVEETEPTPQKEEQKETVSQDFTYTVETSDEENNKTTQEATVTVTTDSGNGGSTSYNYPSNAVMASSFGFRTGDATAAFEAAIKSGSSYVVIDKQSSDWVIRPTRFFDLQNMTIVFEPGVVLRAKPWAFREGNRLFEMVRAENVTVEGSGATFKMNKSEYTSGEQRHAFSINNCNDITVRGLTIRDSGGAGIMIYGGGNSAYSKNITVENVKSLNNRRDGITITSAENVWVRNSEFSKSSGTMPQAGVVLESDNPTDRLVNINFANCKFSDNNNAGIHLSTRKLNGGSLPLSVKVLDCEFSNNAISPSGVPPTEVVIGGSHGTDLVGGEIRFERSKFNGSRGRIVFTRKAANGFRAVFKDCEARNVVSSYAVSPISLEAHNSRNTFGGIEFDNFYIQYNRNVPFLDIRAPKSWDGKTAVRLENVRGSFTIQEPADYPIKYLWGYRTDQNVNVSINYKHI